MMAIDIVIEMAGMMQKSDIGKNHILSKMEDLTEGLLRIINGAEKELVLVSPYMQIQSSKSKHWKELEASIIRARSKGVVVTFISRTKDEHNSTDIMKVLSPFRELGCSVFLLDNLHAKIYYNDKEALITSLNLYLASTIKNKEIGVIVDKVDELNSIRDYICEMIGEWGRRSVGGSRAVSRNKAPEGTKQTWILVTRGGTKYYHIKIEGKYPSKIDKSCVSVGLLPGKKYSLIALIKWKTTGKGSKRCYLSDIKNVIQMN